MEALRNRVAQYQQRAEAEVSFRTFGRTDMGMIETSCELLRSTAAWLRSDEELRFDWLEFMSVYERKNKLQISYFIRSQARAESCVLRTSTELKSAQDWIILPSLTILWPMVAAYEAEASRGFGILFQADNGPSPNLPATPQPFPLRKSHVWEGMGK